MCESERESEEEGGKRGKRECETLGGIENEGKKKITRRRDEKRGRVKETGKNERRGE